MNDDGNALPTFKPGDLVRWIGEWQFPLVDAPPRENTVLAIENDGKVHLEGRHGSEAPQRWWCPPDQLVVHCEPVQTATLEVDNNECSACGATFSWNEGADRDEPDQLCNPCAQRIASDVRKARMARTPEEAAAVKAEISGSRLGLDALDLEQRGRIAEVDAVAGDAFELKRIRSIVDEDARKRHGDREGEPSWGVIADCVLAHVSQHRQARELLDVPEQFTLDQYVSMLGDGAELVATRQVLEAMQGRTPDPARSTTQLAREVVDQAERWRMDAESYRSEAATLVAKVLTMTAANASAAEVERFLRDFETGLVNSGKWDPYPELPLNLLAREVVAQAERWRIDAEHYRGEASNATAATVESLSTEVARLTGEVAATRSEAARQIGARDAELAALVARAQRLAADLTSEANECTAHGLVSPATALRGAAAFLTSVGERVPRVFSAASSVEALHLRLEEADRHLAGLQEEAKRRDEALREETRKVVEYSNLVDQYKLALAQVQGASASQISTALDPSSGAAALRQRLNYTLLPLGYTMEEDVDADDASIGIWFWNSDADEGGRARKFGVECTTEADAIADAWIDCKTRNDPPGMLVARATLQQGYVQQDVWALYLLDAVDHHDWYTKRPEARAAAWAWYDRRHALHERLRCGLGDRLGRCDGLDFWPLILSWSDDQVAEVERWLVDSTAEMPEVLRG